MWTPGCCRSKSILHLLPSKWLVQGSPSWGEGLSLKCMKAPYGQLWPETVMAGPPEKEDIRGESASALALVLFPERLSEAI